MQCFCSVWIIQDRIDELAYSQMDGRENKEYRYFYCMKDILFRDASELCWKRHRSTDISLANGKYSTDKCNLSEYFVSGTAT